tara:strand:+ start:199 stop:498 length:300 start_codon:yes stop_codon:yes gene_type:complete
MSHWSLQHAQEINDDLVDFIYKRFTNSVYVVIEEKDLYNAIINLNRSNNDAIIAVIKSTSGKNYLLIKCIKEKYIEIINRIDAMYNHHNDIIQSIRQSE